MKDFADDIDRASSLAQIAQAVYDPTKVKTADWQRVTQSELSELNLSEAFSKIKKSGVVSGLYRNQKGDYALSFAGTDFGKIKDIRANLRQGLGLESQQYTDSIKLAKAVREEVKGNLMITGHSKGGGQAIIAGSVTGAQTVTFNPAGVHEKTFAREGLNKSAVNDFAMRTGQIQNFIAKGELLDKVNGLPLIPSAIGQEVDLVSDTMKTKLLSGHSIKHVINLLQERKINLATNSIQHAQQTVSSSKADIGRDILQSYNNVVKQNAPIATLREAITKGYKKSLDNSIDGFAFYGPNAPKELGAAATLNPGLTAELMTAQAAVDTINKIKPALRADKPKEITTEQIQDLKTSSMNNVYGDAFLQAAAKISPTFMRFYMQTQSLIPALVPSVVTAQRLSDGQIDASLMQDTELKNTVQNLREKIGVIYQNPDQAFAKATKLASNPDISPASLRANLNDKPEILGEIKPIKKGFFGRVDERATQNALIEVKTEVKALSASLQHGRRAAHKLEEGVSKSLSTSIEPSPELSEALAKFDKNPELTNFGKGYDVDKLYTQGQNILEKTGDITKISGKHGFGIKPDALENIKKLKSTVQKLETKHVLAKALTNPLKPTLGPKL